MESNYLYKIVLVGDWGVGKTNILSRYTRGEFISGSLATIGVQFSTKCVNIEGCNVRVQIWDTAGQDKYRTVTSAYYRGAYGALLVYDITRLETFHRLDLWTKELKQYVKEDCVITLIGNKSDLHHMAQVKQEDALKYSKLHNMAFYETSALDATNIDIVFDSMVKEIHSLQPKMVFEEEELHTNSIIGNRLSLRSNNDLPPKKKTCCS